MLFSCSLFYAQDNNMFKNDTTRIKIINKKPYRIIHTFHKINDKLTSQINYKKVDLSNVHFETSKAKLLQSSYKTLDFLATILNDNPTINLKIAGHTDKVGDSKKNLKLSLKRAKAIRLYLLKKDIKDQRLTANGYGDQMLICEAPCKDNQRVEFFLEQGDVLPHFLSLVKKNNPELTDEEVKKYAEEMKKRRLKWENHTSVEEKH